MSIDDAKLAELEALEKAATPGPWEWDADIPAVWQDDGPGGKDPAVCFIGEVNRLNRKMDDAAFIATARNALGDLIADLREARQEYQAASEAGTRIAGYLKTAEAERDEARDDNASLRSMFDATRHRMAERLGTDSANSWFALEGISRELRSERDRLREALSQAAHDLGCLAASLQTAAPVRERAACGEMVPGTATGECAAKRCVLPAQHEGMHAALHPRGENEET
jgi:hypothetical protein